MISFSPGDFVEIISDSLQQLDFDYPAKGYISFFNVKENNISVYIFGLEKNFWFKEKDLVLIRKDDISLDMIEREKIKEDCRTFYFNRKSWRDKFENWYFENCDSFSRPSLLKSMRVGGVYCSKKQVPVRMVNWAWKGFKAAIEIMVEEK